MVPVASGAVYGVVMPLVEVDGGLSEGVVVAGNGTVEPCAVWIAWGHVVPGGAVETVVASVSAFVESTAAALVSLELAASD